MPENFGLSLEIAGLQVGGGISRTRSTRALERHLPAMQACLRSVVKRAGFVIAARIDVTAEVTERGRLVRLTAHSLEGTSTCVLTALRPTRLPHPDTGSTEIRFAIRYRTVVPP